MPYSIQQHPSMPLLVTSFLDHVNAAEFAQWGAELVQRISALALACDYVYVLMDVRQANTDFSALIRGLASVRKATSESPRAVEGIFAFLGSSPMARLAANMLRQPQYGGIEVAIFLTYEDATAALEADMKLRQRHTQDAE